MMQDYSILELFRQELAVQGNRLKQSLTTLQQQPAAELAWEEGLRSLQTIVSTAQLVDLEPIVGLATALQSHLVAARNDLVSRNYTTTFAPDFLKHVLSAVNLLLRLSQTETIDRSHWLTQYGQELASLTAVLRNSAPAIVVPETVVPEADRPVEHYRVEISEEVEEDRGDAERGMPAIDASIMELFRLEVEEQAEVLNQGLVVLETQPQAAQQLESLMRAAHSIKGAARIVGLDAVVNLAHIMEDCFVAAQNHTLVLESSLIDILLQGVDLLEGLSQTTDRDLSTWLTQHTATMASIRSMIATKRSTEQSTEQNTGQSTRQSTEQNTEASHSNLSFVTAPDSDSQESRLSNTQVSIAPAKITQPATTQPATTQPATTQPATTQPEIIQSEIIQTETIQEPRGAHRVVRVGADNLNRIMGLAGEALIAANSLPTFAESLSRVRSHQNQLAKSLEILHQTTLQPSQTQSEPTLWETIRRQEQECRTLLSDRLTELEEFIQRTTNLSDRLYREVITSHLRPFSEGVQSFPRMVRDLARSLGKQVNLKIVGAATLVDRDILNKLEAPITHILRNAIDHGIERPPDRAALGKPAEGTILLEAVHRGGMLAITIADDGKGIDLKQLQQRAIDRHLITPEVATRLTTAELLEFLFLPGFTLSKQVTELSGRGVGLDIVKQMAQDVGGTVRVTSDQGHGTRFHFQLPLTLSVIRTLLVEVSGEAYAFPLSRIDQILTIAKSEISVVENRQYFTLNQENIGLVPLYQVLDLPPPAIFADPLWVIVLSDQSSQSSHYGLVVDRCLGERELVVRPLDSRLGKVQDISAAAVMEDGSLVLIIDVLDLVRSLHHRLKQERFAKVGETQQTVAENAKRVLVVDDSITVREMTRKILQNRSYAVDVAVDGVEGWNAVRSYPYDLIICDIDMPRMNGIELIKAIKQHSRLQSIPVIVVSYRDREKDRIQGLEAGADYYLTKSSFQDDTLIRAVTDLIGESS